MATALQSLGTMRRLTCSVLAAALLSLASTAHADEGAEETKTVTTERPQAPATTSSWYGWQTLATDGGAALMAFVSAKADGPFAKDALGGAAIGTYVLGAPIVHAAHARVGATAGSLGLRLGSPVVFGLVGGILGGVSAPKDDGSLGGAIASGTSIAVGMFYGVLVGMGVASGIDAAALAHEKVPVEKAPDAAARPTARAIRIVPTFAVTREGGDGSPRGARAVLGAAATF